MQVYAQVVTGNCVANGSRAHDARVRARPEARREPETAHMARIKPLDEKTIPEGSRETWAAMHKKFGKVPNLFATFAHSPAAFSGYIAFLSALWMLSTTWLSVTKIKKKYQGGLEIDITLLLAALALTFLGGGTFSIDHLIGL